MESQGFSIRDCHVPDCQIVKLIYLSLKTNQTFAMICIIEFSWTFPEEAGTFGIMYSLDALWLYWSNRHKSLRTSGQELSIGTSQLRYNCLLTFETSIYPRICVEYLGHSVV